MVANRSNDVYTHSREKLVKVTKASPCEICNGDHKCSRGQDGFILCGRVRGDHPGFVYFGQCKGDDQFAQYRREGDPHLDDSHAPRNSRVSNGAHWNQKAERLQRNLTPALRDELSAILGLPSSVLSALPIGYDPDNRRPDGTKDPCWTIPETSHLGWPIGIIRRYRNGDKIAMGGGHRGLTIPAGWRERAGPTLIPEGHSCVMALTAMGLRAVGRPSNTGGVEQLMKLVESLPADQDVILLGEFDANEKGVWPGSKCIDVAQRLASELNRRIRWAFPPDRKVKDVREWFVKQSPDLGSTDSLHVLGQRFLHELEPNDAKPTEKTAAEPLQALIFEDKAWPDPPSEEAFYGLPGEMVATIGPASEADRSALLAQTLIGFGNTIGRSAYFAVESDRHYANEFGVLVGRTGKSRKGTSWGRIAKAYRQVDEVWAKGRVQTGASSGEGIIWAIRDPIQKHERVKAHGRTTGYEDVVVDPGEKDKRLLLYEPEFANVLKQPERTGNNLSAILRQAWDGTDLRSLVKNSPARATEPHVSVIGHITAEELRRYLSATEMANGYGNRHLWVCTARSKILPEGGNVDQVAWGQIVESLRSAVEFGRAAREIRRDDGAREIWRGIYGELTEGRPGLAGAMLARADAHVLRLSMIYALMDCSEQIRGPHLLAAIALWGYVERSVYFVFGDALGDPIADEILRALRANPQGLTRNDLVDYFARNRPSERIGRALGLLLQHQLARFERVETGGRPAERWFAVRK
jgi:hypothetical protein